MSALRLKKLERKIIEKNRRNHMNFLYSRLFSLIPPHIISKGCDQVADRVDRTIEYIQTLKTNLEMNKNKKDKLLSEKRSLEHTKMIDSVCISLHIQIREMSHDHDAFLVTGLKTHSSFCNVVRFLDQYSTEMEAEDICKRLKNLVENTKGLGDDTKASFCNEVNNTDLSVWDFDLRDVFF